MKKMMFLAGAMVAMLCYSCDSETKWEPEPVIPEPEPDTTVVIPGEPLTEYIRPVLTADKRWVKRSQKTPSSEYSEPYTVVVGEDTVIGSLTAKKILIIAKDGTTTTDRIAWESGSRVYRFCSILSNFHPNPGFFLDYDCWASEKFFIDGDDMLWIKPVTRGIITLQGKQRRCTEIKTVAFYDSSKNGKVDYWVEGIGPLFGYISNFSSLNARPTSGGARSDGEPDETVWTNWPFTSQVLECYEGDEKIYDYREFKPELYQVIDSLPLRTGDPDTWVDPYAGM